MEFTNERRREEKEKEALNASSSSTPELVEKEHMFDKVVTPSDVGKLNRLVIPKQHAEKYFPFDTSVHEKGLILNFEDRTGKPWRFRYSYWNSSQSYVMTKGWSRFVKEKRLDAGDTVSFIRGIREKDRFFIDWKRRPEMVNVHPRIPMHFNRVNYPMVSFGSPMSYMYNGANGAAGGGQYLYFRQAVVAPPRAVTSNVPIVLESVPLVQGQVSAKRVRLFGVNLDEESSRGNCSEFSSSASPSPKGKESEELSLDLEM